MNSIHHKYRRFKEWEQQPHQVAPLSEEHHECATCGTHYDGNYCPRCGQSSRIGRYSFKNAILLYLDVWGLGNRGMFRSIRDLLLRPGYMIRDYLRGMQMAYFPPFKLFFLLIALWLLIDSGLNIQGINRDQQNEKETKELVRGVLNHGTGQVEVQEKQVDEKTDKAHTTDKRTTSVEKEKKMKRVERVEDIIADFIEQHSSVVTLAGLLVFSLPLCLLFRHSPAIPDLRLSECFVAMVYITDMIVIYDIIPSLFCFSVKAEIISNLAAYLLAIIPIKQLSGYSYWTTIWRLLLAFIPFIVISVLLAVVSVIVLYLIV